jgi:hypothetical protein
LAFSCFHSTEADLSSTSNLTPRISLAHRADAPPIAAYTQISETATPLFDGFFLAGFECSDHKLEDGRRLDLLTSTRHDDFAAADYARARALGITACRDGISWVRCERSPGHYDFSSVLPRLRAAEGVLEVIWDLMHFGWPDHVDVFAVDFPVRFGRYAQALARWFADETAIAPRFTAINEMSFLSWAGGDVGVMNPYQRARGFELKTQFVLATIEAIEAIRSVLPSARFLHSEPAINIVPSPEYPLTWRRVESDNLLQYQALDMLSGRSMPRLGGDPRYLDVVGVNFYSNNQFLIDGTTIEQGDPRFEPLSAMLRQIWRRYQRPMIVSETGAEGDRRAPWLRYVADECEAALDANVELHGVTLYPILDHPGWVDDRHCPNGLWGYADDAGQRAIHAPLAAELQVQNRRLSAARAAMLKRVSPAARKRRATSQVGAEY